MTTKRGSSYSDNDGPVGFVMRILLLFVVLGVIGMTLKTCSVKEKANVKTKNSTTKKASNGQFRNN